MCFVTGGKDKAAAAAPAAPEAKKEEAGKDKKGGKGGKKGFLNFIIYSYTSTYIQRRLLGWKELLDVKLVRSLSLHDLGHLAVDKVLIFG